MRSVSPSYPPRCRTNEAHIVSKYSAGAIRHERATRNSTGMDGPAMLCVRRNLNQFRKRLPMPWMWAVAAADAPCIPARHPDPCSNNGVRYPSKQRLNLLGIDLTCEPGWLARDRPRTAGLCVLTLSIRLFGPGFGSIGDQPPKPRSIEEALRGDANRAICTAVSPNSDSLPATATNIFPPWQWCGRWE